jgi:hypothetical protein
MAGPHGSRIMTARRDSHSAAIVTDAVFFAIVSGSAASDFAGPISG